MWEVSYLFEYWQEYPPTHILVAAYLGSGRNRSRRGSRATGNFEELAQAIIGAGGRVNKKLPSRYKG